MTTAPAPPPPADTSDELHDQAAEDPQSSDEPPAAPFVSLLARAKVLEQAMEGAQQRRNSLLDSSRRGSSENNAPLDAGRRGLKKSSVRSSRSFRMSFVLTAGDDGLDDLVKNISSEGTDRRTLLVHAALVVWEHRRAAAALRGWKEILRASSDALLQLATSGDINEEARKVLYGAEAARTAAETAATLSPRAGQHYDTVAPVKFARRDLDLLVVWARQLQAKTFPPDVDDTSVRETMRFLRFRQYQDGEALFFEGEVGETFYFLFQGTVAVYVGSAASQLKRVAGTRRTARIAAKPDLRQLGKRVFAYRTGEGFGETAMFTNDAIRTASAVAAGTCEVCELPKEVYRRTLKRSHQQFFAQAQKINFVQRVALFRDWQRGRLGAVADVLEKRKMAFGDHLLVEGATPLTACFFVLSGLVKLTKQVDTAPPPAPPAAAAGHASALGKKPRHRIHMRVELQTLGVAEIVALEALVEPNERATYSAVAASANVELYVLKEVDARAVLGTAQSALFQRVRELCAQDLAVRSARLAAARHAFQAHEALKKDAELLRSQDDFAESEQLAQSARRALDAQAEATLQATNAGAFALVSAGAAPFLPHLRATSLLELAKAPYVPLSPSSRAEHEALSVVSSPKMLSLCAKNFVFEHANALASDYPERLRLSFPPAPAADRSLVERVTALMAPASPSPLASPRANVTTLSPRRSARRLKPTSEARDAQRVLEQQLARLPDARVHWDATRQHLVLQAPAAAPARQSPLRQELRSTQQAARALVDAHLRRVSERRAETPGQPTFLHFF